MRSCSRWLCSRSSLPSAAHMGSSNVSTSNATAYGLHGAWGGWGWGGSVLGLRPALRCHCERYPPPLHPKASPRRADGALGPGQGRRIRPCVFLVGRYPPSARKMTHQQLSESYSAALVFPLSFLTQINASSYHRLSVDILRYLAASTADIA